MARERFAGLLKDPAFAGLAWPNVEKAIDFFMRFETEVRGEIERIFVERQGELVIPLRDGSQFRLTARADRIDTLARRRGGPDRLQERARRPARKR